MQLPQTDSLEEDNPAASGNDDGVYVYATELLTLGLIWHGFHDSIKEGDGDRILIYWKFLLIIFKVAKCYNYAKEAVYLLLQHKAQLLWSRCVNTRGVAGGNIPGDLHNEHLNRRLKNIIAGQGSNVNPDSVVRAGNTVMCIQPLTKVRSNKHTIPELGKDFDDIMKVLVEEVVFVPTSNRQHRSFTFKCGMLENCHAKNY